MLHTLQGSRNYRKLAVCRVPQSLSCAIHRAHDKQPLHRVLEEKHTTYKIHTAYCLCAVCSTARPTHGKLVTTGPRLDLRHGQAPDFFFAVCLALGSWQEACFAMWSKLCTRQRSRIVRVSSGYDAFAVC